MKGELFDRYVEACDYPGRLDPASVQTSLAAYCAALGVCREVRRLDADFLLDADFRGTVLDLAEDIAGRLSPRAARDARAARAARDALDALDARDARAARAARDPVAPLRHLAQWAVMAHGWYTWSWDLSWMVCSYFGSEGKAKVAAWSRPLLQAYLDGAWCLFWSEKSLFWVAKPTVCAETIGNGRRPHCSFEVVAVERDRVTIRDLNLGGKTVTNDAEHAVEQLRAAGFLPSGRRLFYYDSAGALDEIVWEGPGAIEFRPGPGRAST